MAKKRKGGKKMNPLTRGALIFSLVFVGAVAAYLIYSMLAVKSPAEGWLRVPHEATGKTVRDSLSRHFGDDFTDNVMAMLTIDDTTHVRSGAYHIDEGATAFSAARKIRGHRQDPVTITINGFRSLDNLAAAIARKTEPTTKEILTALTSAENLKPYGLTPEQALALCTNTKFEVFWDADPKAIFNKLAESYKGVWTDTRKRKAEALGLTPAEVSIIASIVDEETNNLGEKGRIGRLYINRLKKGMKLQADPTVRFAIGDFSIRRVTAKHLAVDSPYNTYRHQGLPPGPIRTVSTETIDAILDSKPSEDLYMCAREDFSGTHNFASTYEEHMQNARRYQDALDKRGIK